MLEYFAHDTAISAPYHKDTFWIRVTREGEMGNHFLVADDGVNVDLGVERIVTYENSSRSVHCITPSRTRTLPYVSDKNTRTSWYRDFSTCKIFVTLRVMA